MADHARDAQAASRHHALLVIVPAVEVGVGHDRLARHLVEGDVLRREARGGRDDERVADAIGIRQRPLQRLHRSEGAADHRGEALDAEAVGEARLRLDPVFDRHDREVGAPGLAGGGIDRSRPGGAETAPQVIRADDEEAPRIERLARPDQVVPPADIVSFIRIEPSHVVRGIQRVAHQHRVGASRVQRAVGLVRDVVGGQLGAAAQADRRVEMRLLREYLAYGGWIVRSVHVSLAEFVVRPQADANRRKAARS